MLKKKKNSSVVRDLAFGLFFEFIRCPQMSTIFFKENVSKKKRHSSNILKGSFKNTLFELIFLKNTEVFEFMKEHC